MRLLLMDLGDEGEGESAEEGDDDDMDLFSPAP
jgi:hypothetical protein